MRKVHTVIAIARGLDLLWVRRVASRVDGRLQSGFRRSLRPRSVACAEAKRGTRGATPRPVGLTVSAQSGPWSHSWRPPPFLRSRVLVFSPVFRGVPIRLYPSVAGATGTRRLVLLRLTLTEGTSLSAPRRPLLPPTGDERFRESLVATRELAEIFLDLLELLAEPLLGFDAGIEQLGAMLRSRGIVTRYRCRAPVPTRSMIVALVTRSRASR